MKKPFSLLLILLLASCSNIKYNDNEYIRYVNIQLNIQKVRDTCPKLDLNKLSALKDLIQVQYLYAESMMYRSDLKESTEILKHMIEPLNEKSSPAFCVDKLNNAEDAVTGIMKLEAQRPW